MASKGRKVRLQKDPEHQQVPVEFLLIGYLGLTLNLVGAALPSQAGDLIGTIGLLVTLGSGMMFFVSMITAHTVRE